jgi:hypothetical protein
MRLNLRLRPDLLLLLNAATVVLAALAFTALMQTDRIVHGTLYYYGLQFDLGWADPYWLFFRLAMALLIGVAAVGSFSMLYVMMTHRRLHDPPTIAVPPARTMESLHAKALREKEPKPRAKPASDDGVEIVAIPMVCNKCDKVFSQPLCMFDFRSGKPRLVNVCPYCNAVLTVSGEGTVQ